MADGVQALCHTWPLLRVRLMEHALVAVTGGTWLVGVDTRYDNKAVFGFFLDIDQAAGVVQDRILVIGGTRSDDDEKFIAFSADNLLNFFITFSLVGNELRRKRELFLDLCRSRQFVYEFECHSSSPRFVNSVLQPGVQQSVCCDNSNKFAR